LIRLDKFLCDAQIGTRSEVKALIKKGRVTVGNVIVKSPELKIDETSEEIQVDGRTVSNIGNVYYMLHKPAGYITATQDAHEATVMDLLKDAPGKELFPVGRLDKDTEGLLLITNDGELGHRLLSPRKHVDKTYLVYTSLPITASMLTQLENGVDIGDETRTLPAKAKACNEPDRMLLTIVEGRFHQVKRMLHAVGNEVTYLKRLSMGSLILDDTLKKGAWRPLTAEELKDLGVK